MSAPELILEATDSLPGKDFKRFKWYLAENILDGCKPIHSHFLEEAERTDTVSKLTKSYGDETAVTLTLMVLRKMNQNKAAKTLENKYRESEGGNAASSTTSSSAADNESMASYIDLK